MASAQDILKAIQDVNGSVGTTNGKLDITNTKLDSIDTAIEDVKTAVDQMNATLQAGITQIVGLLQYVAQALFHESQQNDTIICELEKISKNTCAIWNEAHLQTALQAHMDKKMSLLAALSAAANAEVALTLKREEELKDQIEKCCPPPQPQPVCTDSPCPKPPPLPPPKEPPPPPPNKTEPH